MQVKTYPVSVVNVGMPSDPGRADAIASAVRAYEKEHGKTIRVIWHSPKDHKEQTTIVVDDQEYHSIPKGGVRSGSVYIMPIMS